ncbi:MAG: hypothetical protein ACTSPS_09840, partial [Promethearchaeota archaeon]
KQGIIDVSLDVLKGATKGLLAINISPDIICPHSFVAYLDKNLKIRDYFMADFKIQLPEISSMEKVSAANEPQKKIIDVDLIRFNIPAIQLTYIIKSIFSNQKIVLIFDQEFLYDHIHNFFKYITKGSFEPDISIISKEMYNNEKKKYKESMVFESYNMLNNPKKIINTKDLDIEKQLVSRFLTEKELHYSYVILKNEIQKIAELSRKIKEFIKEHDEKNEDINILKIHSQLEDSYNTKINMGYFKYLLNIIRDHYEIAIPSFTESFLDLI